MGDRYPSSPLPGKFPWKRSEMQSVHLTLIRYLPSDMVVDRIYISQLPSTISWMSVRFLLLGFVCHDIIILLALRYEMRRTSRSIILLVWNVRAAEQQGWSIDWRIGINVSCLVLVLSLFKSFIIWNLLFEPVYWNIRASAPINTFSTIPPMNTLPHTPRDYTNHVMSS